MKYSRKHIEKAIEHWNNILLEQHGRPEMHEMFNQLRHSNILLEKKSSKGDEKNKKIYRKVLDKTEKYVEGLKTPEDLQKFVERNRSKVEEALSKMDGEKKSKYQKAWDFICSAASKTVSFIASNIVLIAQMILVLVLGWVFRDQLKWIWGLFFGKHEEQRHGQYQDAVKKTEDAAKQHLDASKEIAKDDYFKEFVQKCKSSDGEGGKKLLDKMASVQIDKGIEAARLAAAEEMRASYDKDPSGMSFKLDKALGSTYEDALAMVCRSIRQTVADDQWNTLVDGKLEALRSKGDVLSKMLADKLEEYAKLDTSDKFEMGYTRADIEGQNAVTTATLAQADVQTKLRDACKNASNYNSAASKIIRELNSQERQIDAMKKKTHDLLMSCGRDAAAHRRDFGDY